MRIERFANRAETTLNGAVLSGDTAITVTDASVFPSEGDFRLICENELLKCTGVSGSVLTVERAIENSVATGHPSGASIIQTLTEAGLQTWGRDNVPLWNSGRPPYRLVDDTGAPLTSSDYTAVNAATNVTITDAADGSIAMLATPAASAYAICLARSMPASKTLVAALRPILQQTTAGFMRCFFGFRESATGKLLVCGPSQFNGTLTTIVQSYDSPTSLNTKALDQPLWMPGADAYWLKLELDGSNNLNFYIGDGTSNWMLIYTEAKTVSFATEPDEFLFGLNASGSKILNRLVAWQEG